MSGDMPTDPTDADLRPGDQAHPGTPGTGENLCPDCGGSGRTADDARCETCAGTGRVIEGVGGA